MTITTELQISGRMLIQNLKRQFNEATGFNLKFEDESTDDVSLGSIATRTIPRGATILLAPDVNAEAFAFKFWQLTGVSARIFDKDGARLSQELMIPSQNDSTAFDWSNLNNDSGLGDCHELGKKLGRELVQKTLRSSASTEIIATTDKETAQPSVAINDDLSFSEIAKQESMRNQKVSIYESASNKTLIAAYRKKVRERRKIAFNVLDELGDSLFGKSFGIFRNYKLRKLVFDPSRDIYSTDIEYVLGLAKDSVKLSKNFTDISFNYVLDYPEENEGSWFRIDVVAETGSVGLYQDNWSLKNYVFDGMVLKNLGRSDTNPEFDKNANTNIQYKDNEANKVYLLYNPDDESSFAEALKRVIPRFYELASKEPSSLNDGVLGMFEKDKERFYSKAKKLYMAWFLIYLFWLQHMIYGASWFQSFNNPFWSFKDFVYQTFNWNIY